MSRTTRFRFPVSRENVPVLAAVALALVLGLPLLDWGLPAVEEEAVPAKKALEMWGFATGRLHLDPETAGWPAFSFYAQLALQHVQYGLGRLTGAYADRLDYWLAWQLDPSAVILWGRGLAVALFAAVAGLGAAAGRRVAGLGGAWSTGLLLAASPLAVRHARLVGPDAWVTFFAAVTVLVLLDLLAHGRRRDYVLAAAAIGLGAASKYTPGLLAISLFQVHLERRRVEGRSLRVLGLDDRRLWLAALVCVVVFVAATPTTLLDLDVLQRDVGAQTEHMGQGHFGQQSDSGYIYYGNHVLPAALGWPAYLAALAGLVLARFRPEARVLIWCALPLVLVLGALGTRFDRYMLPVLPALALGPGLLLGTVSLRWPRVGRGPVLAVVVAALVALPLRDAVRLVADQGHDSTQAAATAWLDVRAAGASIATERYGPHLVTDPAIEFRDDPVFARLDAARRRRLTGRPYRNHLVIPMYSIRPEGTAAFYDLRHFLGYDLIVTSGAVRNRYLAEPARFPRQVAFYADLERWAPLVFTAGSGEDLRGPEIRIHRVTDATRRQVRAAGEAPTVAGILARREGAGARDFAAFVAAVAYHAALAERWQQAVPYAAAMRALADPAGRPDATRRLAVARFLSGDVTGAEPLFRELADVPAEQVVALGYLGVIAEQRGDSAAAAAFYRQVMALDPSGHAGDLARGRLQGLAAAGVE